MKILISGSNGYLGKELCKKLSKYNDIIEFDIINGYDIFNEEQLVFFIKESDFVVNLAAIGDIYDVESNPNEAYRINVLGAQLIADCCLTYKKPLLHISTCCVYGNKVFGKVDETTEPEPTEPYAQMKLEAEYELLKLRDSGLKLIIARLATCYGGDMRPTQVIKRFLDLCMDGQPITIQGTGEQCRTFTHISDIVSGLEKIIRTPNWDTPILNISSEVQLSINTLAEKISDFCNKKCKIEHVGERSGQIHHQPITSKKMRDIYGWTPKISIDEGLKDIVHNYNKKEDSVSISNINSMGSYIVITGCSGLIGSNITKSILEQGGKVFGIDLVDPPLHLLQNKNFVFCKNDVRYVTNIEAMLNYDIEGFVHLASPSRVMWVEEQPGLCTDIMLNGTRNIVTEALKSHSKWFLLGSSREVYGEPDTLPVTEDSRIAPINLYGYNKVECERIVKDLIVNSYPPIRTSVLRYSNVYGVWHDHHDRVVPSFVKSAICGLEIDLHGSDRLFDFTHIDDVVRITLRAIEKLRKSDEFFCCHVTTGEGTTLEQLSELAMKHTGNTCKITYSTPRQSDPGYFIGSNKKCEKVLGTVPLIGIEKGVSRLIHEWRDDNMSLVLPHWRRGLVDGNDGGF